MKKNKILKGSPPISVLFTDDINAALCSKIEETANVSQKSELPTPPAYCKSYLKSLLLLWTFIQSMARKYFSNFAGYANFKVGKEAHKSR